MGCIQTLNKETSHSSKLDSTVISLNILVITSVSFPTSSAPACLLFFLTFTETFLALLAHVYTSESVNTPSRQTVTVPIQASDRTQAVYPEICMPRRVL